MLSEQVLDSSRQKYLREKNSKINYENQLAMIPLKVRELNAGIAVRKAELADTKLKLGKSEVKVPFDGQVYDKSVEISQVVQAGQIGRDVGRRLGYGNSRGFKCGKYRTL